MLITLMNECTIPRRALFFHCVPRIIVVVDFCGHCGKLSNFSKTDLSSRSSDVGVPRRASYLAATGTSFFLIFLRCSNEMRRSKTDDSKCPANWRICSSCRYRYQHMPRDGHGCQANNILRKAHLLPLHSTIQYTSIDRLDLRFLSTYRGALALQISLWSNHGNRLLLQDSHHRTYSFGCLTHPGPAWPGHRRIAEYMFSERHKVFWHVCVVRLLSFPSLLRFKVVLFNRSLDQYLVKSVLSYV